MVEGASRRGAFLPAIFIGLLATLVAVPRIALHDNLPVVHLAAVGVLAVWYLALYFRDRADPRALNFRVRLAAPHYVQACLHLSIYIFWGFYWELVAHNALLLVAQIAFAFAFEGLLAWSRHKPWRLGLGPLPIIFSINLFLTFKDDWFVYQFVLIAVGFLAKEFIVWQRDGVRTHIFNPSALALFLFALVLIASGQTDTTWVSELSATLDTRLVDPDSRPYLFLFAIGLVAQFLFRVTLVTLASAGMLFLLGSVYSASTGTYWFVDTGIPVAVFLGLHLLITDPATSPRNSWGRFLFGAFYGAGVFALYGLLDLFGEPLAYDKLLFVPVLNLLVIPLDHAGAFLARKFTALYCEGLAPRAPRLRALRLRERFARFEAASFIEWNLVHMAAWIGIFAWMYFGEFIESDHPGRHIEHWQTSCAEDRPAGCSNLAETLRARCTRGAANRCDELAALYERRPDLATRVERQIWYGFACDAGARRECVRYRQNLTSAMQEALESQCESGDAMSCYVIGSGHFKGIHGGRRDPAAAHGYILRGCELGMGKSCAVAGMMHQFGIGVGEDLEAAAAYHEDACGRSFAPSCASLAELYGDPNTPLADLALSEWYRAKACALGAAPLCKATGAD